MPTFSSQSGPQGFSFEADVVLQNVLELEAMISFYSNCRFSQALDVAVAQLIAYSTEDNSYSARGIRFDSQQLNIPWMACLDDHISLLCGYSFPL